MLTENLKTFEKVSDEQRIDLIRNLRNELINLHIYFKENYNYELNAIREEFIKKELRELLISSVDLVQYATLLLEMKHADGTASLTINNDDLFYEELETIFRKYTM